MKVGVSFVKKISVLMSVYNEPNEWLEYAITSILIQTYRNFEFIIVCDNPKNKSLVQFLQKKEQEDRRIKLIINDNNIGLAKSLNKAYEYSEGEYIARMDADDIAYPNRFMQQITFMQENNSVDLLCGNVDIINETGNIIKYSKNIEYTIEQLKKLLEVANDLIHPTFFMTRKAFEIIGGYRPFPAAEDYDFILNLMSQGLNIYQFPETVLKYRIRENSMSYGNALVSQLSTTYIQKLYLERKKSGVDSFNFNEVQKIINVDSKEKEKYSNILYNIRGKYNSNKIMKFFVSLKGLIISRYFRMYFFDLLKVSHTIKKCSRQD